MLRVNWERFGASVRAQTVVTASRFLEVEKELGLSHARMINAAQGKPVGTDIFLTLCHWMQQDPLWFCEAEEPASADTRPKDEDPLGASLASGAVGEAGTPNLPLNPGDHNV